MWLLPEDICRNPWICSATRAEGMSGNLREQELNPVRLMEPGAHFPPPSPATSPTPCRWRNACSAPESTCVCLSQGLTRWGADPGRYITSLNSTDWNLHDFAWAGGV